MAAIEMNVKKIWTASWEDLSDAAEGQVSRSICLLESFEMDKKTWRKDSFCCAFIVSTWDSGKQDNNLSKQVCTSWNWKLGIELIIRLKTKQLWRHKFYQFTKPQIISMKGSKKMTSRS